MNMHIYRGESLSQISKITSKKFGQTTVSIRSQFLPEAGDKDIELVRIAYLGPRRSVKNSAFKMIAQSLLQSIMTTTS